MADITNNVEFIMKERIEPNIGETYEDEYSLCSWVNNVDAERISKRAMRIVLEVARGGDTGGVDLDGGDNFAGSRSTKKLATLNTVAVAHDRIISRLAQYATETNEQAIENDLSREVSHAIAELKVQEDIYLQASTDGVLAIITDIAGAPTYSVKTDAGANNPFGPNLLREGAIYQIYDSTLATLRANGPYRIDPDGGIDHREAQQTVTLTASITAGADNDRFVIPNMVNAAFQGVPYHITGSTAGQWQGINRTKAYARANSVDANKQPLAMSMFYLLRSLIRMRTGEALIEGLTPYLPVAQEQGYLQLAQPALIINKREGSQDFDLTFGQGTIFNKKALVNIHANQNKIFFLQRNTFVRAETRKLGFKTDSKGNRIFPKYSIVNGAPKNEDWFQVEHVWQLGARKVNQMGVIENIQVPPGLVGTIL